MEVKTTTISQRLSCEQNHKSFISVSLLLNKFLEWESFSDCAFS